MRKLKRNISTGSKKRLVLNDNTTIKLMKESIKEMSDSKMIDACEHIIHLTKSHKSYLKSSFKNFNADTTAILKFGNREHHNALYILLYLIYEYLTLIDIRIYPKDGYDDMQTYLNNELSRIADDARNYLPSESSADNRIEEPVNIIVEDENDRMYVIGQYVSQIYKLAVRDQGKNIINSYFNGYDKGKKLFSKLYWPITFNGGDIFDVRTNELLTLVTKSLKVICDYMTLKEPDVKMIPEVIKAYGNIDDCIETYWEDYNNPKQQEFKYIPGTNIESDICLAAYQLMVIDTKGYAMDLYPLAFSDNYPKYFNHYFDNYNPTDKQKIENKVLGWLNKIHKAVLKDTRFSRYYIKKYIGDIYLEMHIKDKSFLLLHDDFIHKATIVGMEAYYPVCAYILDMIKKSGYPVLPEYTSIILATMEKIRHAYNDVFQFNYSSYAVREMTRLCSSFAYIWDMNRRRVTEMFKIVKDATESDKKKFTEYLNIVNDYYKNPRFLKARYISLKDYVDDDL